MSRRALEDYEAMQKQLESEREIRLAAEAHAAKVWLAYHFSKTTVVEDTVLCMCYGRKSAHTAYCQPSLIGLCW